MHSSQGTWAKRVVPRLFVYGGLLVLIGMLLPWWARKQLYHPPPTGADPLEPMHEVELRNRNGQKLSAWFQPGPSANAPLVLFFYGNAQDASEVQASHFTERMSEMGVHLMIVDYPGFGRSEGSPSEEALLDAAAAAMDWSLSEYPATPKVLMGWSLGAAVAIQTAARYRGHYQGLVLISPWSRLSDLARFHYPSWLVRIALRESYDSINAAEQVQVPSLVVHGKRDDIIPFVQGMALAQKLGVHNTCQWISIPELGHNDILGSSLVWTHLNYYLREIEAH